MNVEAITGNRMSFERCWREAERLFDCMPATMTVDYWYKLGTSFDRFGKLAMLNSALAQAIQIAEANSLTNWYLRYRHALKRIAPVAVAEL